MTRNPLIRFLARRAPKRSRSRTAPARYRPDLLVLEDRSNPAHLWVASAGAMSILNDVGPTGFSIGDTVRIALPGGQFTDGTLGTTAFNTVESAVGAANANADPSNAIRVSAGTFTLNTPQVAVTKNLSLIGFGQGTTTIRAGANTTTGGASPTADTSATVLVNRGVSLNLSSLTLDGGSAAGTDVPVLVKFTDTGSGSAATSILSDVAIQNVGTAGGTATTAGVGVYAAHGSVTVTASAFQNIGTHAVLYRGGGATGSVLGSTFTGQGVGTRVNVAIGAEDAGTVTIRGNAISGFLGTTGGADSAGVSVQGAVLFTPAVDVANNQFAGNRIGVSIGGLLNLGSTTVVNNNFLNNTLAGISSLTGGLVNGLQNFFQGAGLVVAGVPVPGLSLTGSVSVSSTPPTGSIASVNGAISGRVTDTTTGNGVAGVTVFLDANLNGVLDQTEVAVVTDAAGNFTFSGLTVFNQPTPTAYRVKLVVSAGATAGATTAVTVNLTPLQVSASGVNLNVTLPSGTGGGAGGPTDSAGTPQGPGRPTDGSRLRLTAGAAGFGSGPQVIVYNPDGSIRFSFMAFDVGFKGGVRVATGDINHDGVDDIIVGAGAGAGPHVKVYDGATGTKLRDFFAFDVAFRGGVAVASGDLNRDGFDDVIVGAASGSAPHVKVFDGATGAETASFFAFDAGFKGGVTVAAGDVNGDGWGDVVVGAAPGAGPHVRVFSGRDQSVLHSFFAFAPEFRGGVTIAAGDVNGDGRADVIVGAGAGGDPRVSAFDGGTGRLVRSFLAYDSGFKGGVDVGYTTRPDGRHSLITGAGNGGRSHIRYFAADTGNPEESYFAWESGMSGINVS